MLVKKKKAEFFFEGDQVSHLMGTAEVSEMVCLNELI